MSTLTSDDLLTQMRWRYAVKQFDAARKIPAAAWSALEESLVLSPSSFGLQPWRFVVVEGPDLRARLRPATWNQSQVTDASHYVVFAGRREMGEAEVDAYVRRICDVRGVTPASVQGFRDVMVRFLAGMTREKQAHWAALQTYIALGNFMTSAAALGIDTCPIEGLDPAKYDAILGLPEQGFGTLCACAAGYRAASDKHAAVPKVRFDAADVVKHV